MSNTPHRLLPIQGRRTSGVEDLAHSRQLGFREPAHGRVGEAIFREELCFHYQPEVDMLTGEVLGFEALVRWNHPTQGLLSPAALMPAVEAQSLHVELGRWELDAAIRQLSCWSNAGIDTSVSVNLSSLYLEDECFIEDLKAALTKYVDVRPSRLGLELLESSAIKSMPNTLRVMRQATDLGVWFAIDDFGTGYSSFSYLKELPTRLVKIDKSFVNGICDGANDLKIVQAIVGLSHALGKRVIAEGVETMSHREALMSVGCVLAQGYGIARPMSADRVSAWMSERSQMGSSALSRRLEQIDFES